MSSFPSSPVPLKGDSEVAPNYTCRREPKTLKAAEDRKSAKADFRFTTPPTFLIVLEHFLLQNYPGILF